MWPMKLLAGSLGEMFYWAASVPLVTVLVLEIAGRMNGGWPFYAAWAVWFFVALPISVLRKRAKKAASGRPLVTN
jgi:hypothetical protein